VIVSVFRKSRVVRQQRERIARLLHLPHVSRFGTHPVAPLAVRKRLKHGVDAPLTAAHRSTSADEGAVSKAVTGARHVWHIAGHQGPKRSFPSSTENRGRHHPLPRSIRNANRRSGLDGWINRKSDVSIQTKAHDLNLPRSGSSSVSLRPIEIRSVTRHAVPYPRRTQVVARSFAPVPVSQDEREAQQTDRVLQRIAGEMGTRAVSNDAAVHTGPGTEAGWKNTTAEIEADPTSKGLDQSNGKPSSRSGVIHLDSASLGRWTVEHLAWTLSRESTGMTGIDPRISAPRSRLSPF